MRLPLRVLHILAQIEELHLLSLRDAALYFGVEEADIRSARRIASTRRIASMAKEEKEEKKDGKVIAPGQKKDELKPGPRPPPGSKPEPVKK